MFFRITGGEPLLSRHTFKVLGWLQKNPQKNLELSINSNLGVPQKQFDKFIKLLKPIIEGGNIKGHMLHTSLDTWGEQAKYIRYGLDLDIFQKYIDCYLEEISNSSLAIMCTFNALSVVGFRSFLEWILSMRKKNKANHCRVLLDIPHLQSPEFFSCKILTPDFYPIIENHISFMEKNTDENKGFQIAEIQKLERILNWMKANKDCKNLEQHRRDFYLFFTQYDQRRKTNFLEVFPEMKDFYLYCKKVYELHV